jgi:lantibiotic modifying enzyme
VAERLEVLAVETQSEATWIGIVPDARVETRRWTVKPLGIDLHSGLAGVVWFLARLSTVTGDGRWRRLAGRAAQGWVAQIASSGRETSIGAFVGWGGLVYVAAHLFSLWREPVWLERAARWRSRIEEFLSCDRDFDLSTGTAGAILGLAALQAVERSASTRDVIRACAEHLLARAPPESAGVALGLTVAATETGDARYAKAARGLVVRGSTGLIPGSSFGWHQGVEQWDLGHLERLVSQGVWRCATPWGLETPGLMLGLAGLGDRLLRAAEPSLPGVLGLEPPRGAGRF